MTYADDLRDSQYVYTVDCRTGQTGRKYSPTDVPEDRPSDAPTPAEVRAEEGR